MHICLRNKTCIMVKKDLKSFVLQPNGNVNAFNFIVHNTKIIIKFNFKLFSIKKCTTKNRVNWFISNAINFNLNKNYNIFYKFDLISIK